ncbi:MAG TPA: helix-turn-helix transcriptional regulator [Gemmatimonadales bacterium]|nr:helix-turn-helix transcriptional regulator [Gemmatimonadales bacterium]
MASSEQQWFMLFASPHPHPALPFCHAHLKAPRPLPCAYPQALVTIGDHLRKHRLDLGLLQREVAEWLGVTESTVTNWELNRTEAELRFLPRIIALLGFDPRPAGVTLGEQLLVCRTARGLSREAAARILGVDPGTLWKWESDQRTPGRAFLAKIRAFLTSAVSLRAATRSDMSESITIAGRPSRLYVECDRDGKSILAVPSI